MFSQINSSSVFTSGIGLGLHICKSLVEMYNGSIKIESSILLQGTTFVFTFLTDGPLSNLEQRSLPAMQIEGAVGGGNLIQS
jgi:K+-sensing histidine kinase KdpD